MRNGRCASRDPRTVSRWSAGTEEGHGDGACLLPCRYRSVFLIANQQDRALRVRRASVARSKESASKRQQDDWQESFPSS